MYLLELEIQDVRAIRNMSISFRSDKTHSELDGARRWTVFLGENGCGKSTVLRAIALVLGGSRALYQFLDEPKAWVRKGAKSAAIRATILLPNGTEHRINFEFGSSGWRSQKNSSNLELLDSLHNRPKRESVLAGYGAFRRPSDREHPYERSGSKGPSGSLASLFNPDAGLFGFEQWAMRLDYEKQKMGRQAIASTLNALLPGMTFKRINRSSGEVLMSTVDGDVPLRQLSEGYQSMAAWAGDLLFRIFSDRVGSVHDPRGATGILLLDEMDLHLHPIWKRQLVEFMEKAFPKLQVIATTHSPLAVQQCDEGELFVIRREDEGPRLVPFVGSPSKLRLSDLFLSPLIGLKTLDSPEVAKLRDEARKIELKPGALVGADRVRLKQILVKLEGTNPISDSELGDFLREANLLHVSREVDALQRIDSAERLMVGKSIEDRIEFVGSVPDKAVRRVTSRGVRRRPVTSGTAKKAAPGVGPKKVASKSAGVAASSMGRPETVQKRATAPTSSGGRVNVGKLVNAKAKRGEVKVTGVVKVKSVKPAVKRGPTAKTAAKKPSISEPTVKAKAKPGQSRK